MAGATPTPGPVHCSGWLCRCTTISVDFVLFAEHARVKFQRQFNHFLRPCIVRILTFDRATIIPKRIFIKRARPFDRMSAFDNAIHRLITIIAQLNDMCYLLRHLFPLLLGDWLLGCVKPTVVAVMYRLYPIAET